MTPVEQTRARATGRDVHAVREVLGLTQAALAEAVGVAKKTAYNWEARLDAPLPQAASRTFARWAVKQLDEPAALDLPLATRRRVREAAGTETESTGQELHLEHEHDHEGGHSKFVPARESIAREMHDAVSRSIRQNEEYSPRELADLHTALFESAGPTLDFVEQALNLGLHGEIARALATGVLNALIDTGTYSLMSRVDEGEVTEKILNRTTALNERAWHGASEKRNFSQLQHFPREAGKVDTQSSASADKHDAQVSRDHPDSLSDV